MQKLSVVMITKNAQRLLESSLLPVKSFADEIILVDDNSTDNTLSIAQKLGAKIFSFSIDNLGQQKDYGVKKAKNDWVLILDSDEIIPSKLAREIKSVLSKPTKYYGFKIPFQNHLFGRPLFYGGEAYAKLILFNKKYAKIEHLLVHEKVTVKNSNFGTLKNKINHYSYASLWQMYKKFTIYALNDAKQKQFKHERSSVKKIIAYPVHMFYSRFIKDQGYKDGWQRLFLDLGFGYMEWLTYVKLAILNLKK